MRIVWTGRAAACYVLLALAAGPAAAQDISVSNTARFVTSGRYDWTIFLVADPTVLRSIASVEYTLHPTFPNPVRTVTNPAGGFALSSSGWGEFNIFVKITFRDRRVRTLQHWLSLQSEPRAQQPAKIDHEDQHGAVRTRNTSRAAGAGSWNWEIFLDTDRKTLGEIKCVKYTLHPTFPQPERLVCTPGSDPARSFLLSSSGWGTFTVGVEIQFTDGDVRRTTHALTFATPAPRK